MAVFGELSYDLTENFTITAGARWFDYDRKFVQHQEQPEGFDGLFAAGRQSVDERGRRRRQAQHDLPVRRGPPRLRDILGRIPGRRQQPAEAASILPRDYQSDELKNYEVGFKSEWLDNSLRFNLAAYYMKWEDFAVQIEDPQDGSSSSVS